MSKNQAAYMAARQDDTIQDGPYITTAKIGDVVYIADVDRQGLGTLDITLASPDPIPDTSWTQIQNNISVCQLGLARITRVFTHHYLEYDRARQLGAMFLLVHVQPINPEDVDDDDVPAGMTRTIHSPDHVEYAGTPGDGTFTVIHLPRPPVGTIHWLKPHDPEEV